VGGCWRWSVRGGSRREDARQGREPIVDRRRNLLARRWRSLFPLWPLPKTLGKLCLEVRADFRRRRWLRFGRDLFGRGRRPHLRRLRCGPLRLTVARGLRLGWRRCLGGRRWRLGHGFRREVRKVRGCLLRLRGARREDLDDAVFYQTREQAQGLHPSESELFRDRDDVAIAVDGEERAPAVRSERDRA